MGKKCYGCPYGTGYGPSSLSDWCDGCRRDPDTGGSGFTDWSMDDEDGRSGVHFYSEREWEEYRMRRRCER